MMILSKGVPDVSGIGCRLPLGRRGDSMDHYEV